MARVGMGFRLGLQLRSSRDHPQAYYRLARAACHGDRKLCHSRLGRRARTGRCGHRSSHDRGNAAIDGSLWVSRQYDGTYEGWGDRGAAILVESGSWAGAALRVVPEAGKVDDVQRRYVVRLPAQVVLPEALPPEPEPVHVLVVVAERRVAVRRALRSRVK